jgi:hypothetical protein
MSQALPRRSKVRLGKGKVTMWWKTASPRRPGSQDIAQAGDASAMRDRIDQPKARKAQQADKSQGNGIYDHAMPIIILAFRAFVFREVGDR